jgi:SAM-dependent methyltransferase
MLEMTLATNFIPGTNLKGEVAGANWLFLLPDLNLERVLCLGMPPSTTLTTLLRFSQEVIILGPDSGQILSRGRREGTTRLRPIVSSGSSTLPLADSSIDLALMLRNTPRLNFSYPELRRLLKPGGLIYFEVNGVVDRLRVPEALNGSYAQPGQREGQDFNTPHIFWLTPLGGEMHTAVPLADQETIDYFLQNGLYSPSITERTLKRLLLGRRKSSGGAGRQGSKGAGEQEGNHLSTLAPPHPHTPTPLLNSPRTLAQTTVRQIGKRLLETMVRLEGAISGHRLFGRFTRRYGLLLGQREDERAKRPPHYLRAIAQGAGVDLDGYSWGLAARGDYSSRKLLFFLFAPPSSPPQSPPEGGRKRGPTYIVKMVRDPIFNPRLENEYRALTLLQQKGIGDRETLPRVVFFGHHAGLAIVGQTIIEGVPFRQQTQWTAGCPYLHAATEWLINLSAATAKPEKVTTGLEMLFKRFGEIYQLSPDHRTFLTDQIATIAACDEPFPLVFQHGDPGTWNAMATPSGRVAFLDWEAAEPQGMPLWDLFYFLRSYCVGSARAGGVRDGLAGFAQQFLAETPLSRFVLASVERYCERTSLPTHLVEPLFHTCWMHRALKEATRLPPASLAGGHYVNLMRLGIEQRQTLTLRQLFSLG